MSSINTRSMSTFALSDEDWASRFASPGRTEDGYFNGQGERDDVPAHHPPNKKPKDGNYREYMHDIEDEEDPVARWLMSSH